MLNSSLNVYQLKSYEHHKEDYLALKKNTFKSIFNN